MSRIVRTMKWMMLVPVVVLGGGATCISGIQTQDFLVGESARVIGGMAGLLLQIALRAIIPPTIIV